ncbi:GntR family transcriptional regulator [Paraburkholderia sp. J76]|uniref:GntR family transcriptional regulator n=1 Tax=Paraburkholderia sp. J76 TaxID=2805439 RepID=UPI002ABE8AD4|nr:GntR family transcriptional regulator [Paraburkholderia sp. J76]
MGTATPLELDAIDFPAQIAAQTCELINRGTLAPGLQLRQSDLAGRFRISRVPIREALKLLAAEGIIEHDPNRGFFVAPLSSEEARQLYRMRTLLETELLSTVEWPTPAQVKALKAMLTNLDELHREGDRESWVKCHRAFHETIFGLSPDKVLKRELLRLLRLTDRYRGLAADVAAQREHRNAKIDSLLVKALETKNRALLLATYDQGRTMVLANLMAVLAARGV